MSKQKETERRTDKLSEKDTLFQAKPVALPGIQLGLGKQLECTLPEDLAVVLTEKAFAQVFGYAYATQMEVCLLGIVEREGSVFKVREFFLVAQKGSSAHTELDPAAVGELIERMIDDGRADDVRKIRCWAHSHPGMEVFWSRTDDGTCRLLAADWLLSIVVSDRLKIRCRLDVASPVPFTIDHIPVFYEWPRDSAVTAECEREVKEKLQPLPLLGFERNALTIKSDQPAKERSVDLIEYCEICGAWHVEDECPLQYESGYDLARRENALAKDEQREDDLWF